jgi:hypothetical protein
MLLSILLRVVSLLLLARLLARFTEGLLQGLVEPASAGVDMVRDRVCNTFVPRARALVATIGGRDEYFCSAACRDRAFPLLPAP